MRLLDLILLTTGATLSVAIDSGGSFELWGGLQILSAEATLQLPQAPSLTQGQLIIWPGLHATSHLAFVGVSDGEKDKYGCDDLLGGRWCIANNDVEPKGSGEHRSPVNGGVNVVVKLVWDTASNTTKQIVQLDGAELSDFTWDGAIGEQWVIATECINCQAATMPGYSYVDIRIILDGEDIGFGDQLRQTGVSHGSIHTPDSGRTWAIDWIHFDQHTFGTKKTLDPTHSIFERSPPDYSNYQFGPTLKISVGQDNYIEESETTLNVPNLSYPQYASLGLWPGSLTTGNELIQTITEGSDDRGRSEHCKAKPDQWCIFAATYQNHDPYGMLTAGASIAVDPNTAVNIRYSYDDSNGLTWQTVTIDGQVIQNFWTQSGKMWDWEIAVECQYWCTGNVNAHSYVHTTISLHNSDPKFGDNLKLYEVSTSGIYTSDGGKTWHIDSIHVNEHYFPPVSHYFPPIEKVWNPSSSRSV